MSQAASGYERISDDAYFTPAWVTQALLQVFAPYGDVLDPCAGAAHMMLPLLERGIACGGLDINPQHPGVSLGDFFGWEEEVDTMLINPPYGRAGRLAVKFIERALHLTQKRRGKVAALLRVDFDSAHTRRPIFGDHPAFAAKYVLTKRIRWANIEQSTAGPTDNHAWFVWDWAPRFSPKATLGYLP